MNLNFTAEFQWPYLYGLLNKKKDLLMVELKNGTNQSDFIYNFTKSEMGNNISKYIIPMQFDYRNNKMQYMRDTANILYYVMIALVVLQFFMLLVRNVGFLPVWTLIEYMQLIAFMPIYNFKLIPYLYDTFKPFLVSHLILFNDSFFYPEMNEEFFNTNYLYYDLPIGKFIQSLFNIIILLVLVLITNLCIGLLTLCCGGSSTRFGSFLSGRLS
mmetsp:Transcript_19663/g.14391  ORF Transcript_19663/g.14391 Transcript_19663/m.14391 type:complete len:214 (+) Transcript_19663:1732-2373(+)